MWFTLESNLLQSWPRRMLTIKTSVGVAWGSQRASSRCKRVISGAFPQVFQTDPRANWHNGHLNFIWKRSCCAQTLIVVLHGPFSWKGAKCRSELVSSDAFAQLRASLCFGGHAEVEKISAKSQPAYDPSLLFFSGFHGLVEARMPGNCWLRGASARLKRGRVPVLFY